MGVEVIEPDFGDVPVTARAEALIRDGEKCIEAFYRDLDGDTHRGFIPSDYRAAARLLVWLKTDGNCWGNQFLEWGSGFGIITGLAALAGFNAHGLEQDAELHQASVDLLNQHTLKARMEQESFIPTRFDYFTDGVAQSHQLIAQPCRNDYDYPALEMNLDELDVIYIYPYPGETEMVIDLFERAGGEGAILITYLEDGQFGLYRKTS